MVGGVKALYAVLLALVLGVGGEKSPLHFGRGSCKESVYSPTQNPYGKQVSAVHNSRFSDELDSADQ